MMRRHVVFICNTAYQLFVTIQLRLTAYSSADVDLVLSNQFSSAMAIAENLKSIGLFGQVIYVENRKQTFSSRVAETLHDICLIKKIRKEIGEVNEICFSNISVFTILFTKLFQFKKPKVSIFEDGFVTYSKAFEKMDCASVFSRLLLPKGLLEETSKLWLFSPELLDWQRNNIVICKIEHIDKGDKRMVELLNKVFGYDVEGDSYDKKYLFMEESFFADRYPINDVEIVKGIAAAVGADNLMVKLHPRNSENRFTSLGIKTNTSFAIPWELIILNQKIEKCTLISISSSSILQQHLLFGMNNKCYALLGTLEQRPGNMNGLLGDYMETLFFRFPNVCICPRSLDEFYGMISHTKEYGK